MFSLLEGVYDSYLAPTQLNLLVVGASGVGKTTLLERLKVTQLPKRPSKAAGSQTPPDALTQALHEAFVQGGAEASPKPEDAPPKPESYPSAPAATKPKQKMDNPPVLTSVPTPTPVKSVRKRFSLSICPAPERYSISAQDQEEDFVMDEEMKPLNAGSSSKVDQVSSNTQAHDNLDSPHVPPTPGTPKIVRSRSKEFTVDEISLSSSVPRGTSQRTSSMESIPLDNMPDLPTLTTLDTTSNPSSPEQNLVQAGSEQYDLKPNARMLPMSKIRPTIGSNLAKVEMYGAKCHLFDVGGRLRDLWERYYDDCDAVVFCWKLGEDPDASKESEDDDSEDESFDMSKQLEILNEVRESISDDVPFLIFGHIFGNPKIDLTDKMFETDPLLPHYHNNLTGLCCGSAKTGAGVQHAMEWLIPLAKRQQKERLAARKKMEEKEI